MNAWRSIAAVALLTIIAGNGLAGRGHFCCPDCGCTVCVPEPTLLKTKQHCFEVECKDICIPAVRGPCAPCCQEPACGRVRTVKVLKKVEYECQHCGYKWQVQKICDQPGK